MLALTQAFLLFCWRCFFACVHEVAAGIHIEGLENTLLALAASAALSRPLSQTYCSSTPVASACTLTQKQSKGL